jgi:hypothetical protein
MVVLLEELAAPPPSTLGETPLGSVAFAREVHPKLATATP